jgi:hypothetical protein
MRPLISEHLLCGFCLLFSYIAIHRRCSNGPCIVGDQPKRKFFPIDKEFYTAMTNDNGASSGVADELRYTNTYQA